MNRLTQKDDQGNWSLKGVPWTQLYVGVPMTRETYEKLYGALWKLMKYEDTGVNPNEVERMKDKQTPKTPEIEGDGYADGYMVYDTWICPGCGERYEIDCDNYAYCPKCGQAVNLKGDTE